MAKKIKLGTILPHDTFFYTMRFEQPGQRVTREMLEKHFPEPKGRRAHMGIHTEYKAFKNGLVSVEVKAPDNSENMLFLHVGLTELDVACTCGMPEGKLCYHGYMGLYSIAWQHYLELDRFYWPEIIADDRRRNKFLITDIHKDWISVKPKPLYGNIFKSAIGFKGDQHLSIKEPGIIANAVSGSKEAIAYCLAYNVGNQSNSHLPILMSCLGVTSKSNKEMVSFKQFGRREKPITNIVYTANQQQLNDISFQQYEIVKRISSSSGEGKKHEMVEAKQAMLTLWEQAIPLLLNEKYNYRYYTYWLRYLKDKPRKTDMRDCKYSLERPVLSFLLKFHEDHFSLTAIVSVNGNALKFDYKPHLFVFDEITRLCYLMVSVQDDNLLMWMLSNNRRLTVMKEHFVEFHDTFLAKLNSCYTVLFSDPIAKKFVPYNLKIVTDPIIKRDDYGN
jgi:hypothetical protein